MSSTLQLLLKLVFLLTFVLLLPFSLLFFASVIWHWYFHLHPQTVELDDRGFNRARPHQPINLKRGMCQYGLDLLSYLYLSAFPLFELRLSIIQRWFGVGLRWMGLLSPRKPPQPEDRALYECVMQGILVLCVSPASGHFTLNRLHLPRQYRFLRAPWKSCDSGYYDLVLELDHTHREAGDMYVNGSRVPLYERSSVFLLAMGLGVHPHIHLLSNRIKDAPWSLSQASANMVQVMNAAGSGNTSRWIHPDIHLIIAHNLLHAPLCIEIDKLERVPYDCKLSRMVRACRVAFRQMGWAKRDIDALLFTTVVHSYDHYLTDMYMPDFISSEILDGDWTLFRHAFVPPHDHYATPLLCRQNLCDPVCLTLYRVCHATDPKFADTALFYTIAG
eukprot:TRINITY_DN17051_c0_g1_i1.p1 TRINITY_DN17051_c0_g1~~TRINITY_DN17051_c0_g1_i1.p1  ORF type:complete len:389 (+),score=-14.80 TRINITY_DN17051_c0_g1_i1:150-1316(+)